VVGVVAQAESREQIAVSREQRKEKAVRLILVIVVPWGYNGFVEFLKQKEVQEDCPLCAKYRDPETGELRFNAETEAVIKEVDDMLAGKIPSTLKSFNSLEEMLADLDA